MLFKVDGESCPLEFCCVYVFCLNPSLVSLWRSVCCFEHQGHFVSLISWHFVLLDPGSLACSSPKGGGDFATLNFTPSDSFNYDKT